MYLYKEIKIPIYDCSLYFYVTPDLGKQVKKLNKKYKIELSVEGEVGGLFFSSSCNNYFILLRDDQVSYSKILHELQHFIQEITLHRELESEGQAYLAGHTGSEIISFLLKKNIKID